MAAILADAGADGPGFDAAGAIAQARARQSGASTIPLESLQDAARPQLSNVSLVEG
jgi:hypothetical protein